MKLYLKYVVLFVLVFTSCKKENATKKEAEVKKEVAKFDSFGDKISEDNTITASQMLAKFNAIKLGDTVQVKFASTIKEVCSKKGCWMKLALNDTTQTMVRFKDYGFFMPLDSKNKEVIVLGKAFVKETSVKELQHYAQDAGKTKEEIAQITTPKKEFAFQASGVLLKK